MHSRNRVRYWGPWLLGRHRPTSDETRIRISMSTSSPVAAGPVAPRDRAPDHEVEPGVSDAASGGPVRIRQAVGIGPRDEPSAAGDRDADPRVGGRPDPLLRLDDEPTGEPRVAPAPRPDDI